MHYDVVRNGGGDVAITGDSRSFLSLEELVRYFRSSRGALATRLRRALSHATLPVEATMTRYCEMSYEIDRSDVSFSGGTSPPQVIRPYRLYVGTYRRSTNVRNQSINQSISHYVSQSTAVA